MSLGLSGSLEAMMAPYLCGHSSRRSQLGTSETLTELQQMAESLPQKQDGFSLLLFAEAATWW